MTPTNSSTSQSCEEENKQKNRYLNILACKCLAALSANIIFLLSNKHAIIEDFLLHHLDGSLFVYLFVIGWWVYYL